MTTTSAEAATTNPPERVSFGKLFAWSTSHASAGANFLILGYFSIYCTDTLGLNPGIVGGLLLVSKLVDAVGVLGAGWLVDISPETRFGKARPFDLAIVGMWVFTATLFATPGTLGDVAKYVWVFVSYLLITAVFTPLFAANQPLYMARVFGDRDAYTKVSARSGIIIGAVTIIAAIVVPQLVQVAGKSTQTWTIVGLAFSVPLLLFGTIRFLAVREKHQTEVAGLPRVKFADIRKVLRTNPYLWAVAAISMIVSIFGSFGVLAYYYRYIVGNVGLIGVLAILNVLIFPLLAFAPALVRRFSVSRLIAGTSVLAAIGFLIYSFAGANIALLIVATLFTNLGAVPLSFLLPVLVIDNATYNEWKGNRRLESVGGGVASFATQAGAGVSAAITGAVLAASGYSGTASTQSPTAITAIIALSSWLPAALCVVSALIALRYHRMERQLPTLTAEIRIRQQRAAASVAGSTIAVPGTVAAPGAPLEAVESAAIADDLDKP